jgi:two-component system sensor histidine kinase CssS
VSYKFKNQSLRIQIWIILAGVLLSFVLITLLVIPLILRYSFTKDSYARLEEHQNYIIRYQGSYFSEKTVMENNRQQFFPFPEHLNNQDEVANYPSPPFLNQEDEKVPPFRIIEHLILNKNKKLINKIGPPGNEEKFIEEAQLDIDKGNFSNNHFKKEIDNDKYFYLIKEVEKNDKTFYLLSFLKERYRENFVWDTFSKIFIVIVLVLVISLIATKFIADHLINPINKFEKKVRNIAKYNWNNSVKLERKDEIGKLSSTIDWMRDKLIKQNVEQRNLIQYLSHELKTPIMVLKGYLTSIEDGIYPDGDLDSSLKIIKTETEELEKRVGSLLELSKLDYLLYQSLAKSKISLNRLLEKEVERFKWRNKNLHWQLYLEDIEIIIDKEKFTIVIENIFDNALRYADSLIKIKLKEINSEEILLEIENDGEGLSNEMKDKIFNKFCKGSNGNFGLGMALAKIIMDLHNGEIEVENTDFGVKFSLVLNR